MIEAALVMGGLCGGAGKARIAILRRAGRHLGLAFQIVDDILDITDRYAVAGSGLAVDNNIGVKRTRYLLWVNIARTGNLP